MYNIICLIILLLRYRRYGIKNLSESLEYEAQQRTRRLNRKRSEKLRSQQKSQGSNSILSSATTNVESPLGSITNFEQSGNIRQVVYFLRKHRFEK